MEIKSKCFLVSVKRLKRVRNCYDIKSLPKDKIIYADCLEDINTKVLEIIRAAAIQQCFVGQQAVYYIICFLII